jgi:hypothetical protein
MSDDRADRIAAKLREEMAEMIEVCDPEDQFAHVYIMALRRAINLMEKD